MYFYKVDYVLRKCDGNKEIPFCYSCNYPLENMHEVDASSSVKRNTYKCNQCGKVIYIVPDFGDYNYLEFVK